MLAGRSGEAMEQLHREIAADRHGPAYRCMLFGRLGACYATERPSLALDYLDRALRRPDHDPVHRAWTLTTTAVVAARVGHPRAAQLMEAAGRAHGDAPSPGGEIRLALARAAHAAAAGSAPTAGRILRTADPDSVSARTQAAFLRTERIAGQLTLGEFAAAGAAIEAAAGEIGTLGAAAAPTLTALDCIARLAVGELPEAEARARLALRAPQRLPDEVRADLLAVVVEVLFRRGETTAARDLIDAQSPPVSWPDHLQWFRFGCAAAADPQPARHGELVRRTLWMPDRTLRPLLLVPHHAPRLVRAARLLGDHRRAGAISGHVKRIAGRVNNQLWRGVAHHVDGLVSGDPAALRAAVSRLRTTDARPALADALFDLAAATAHPRTKRRRPRRSARPSTPASVRSATRTGQAAWRTAWAAVPAPVRAPSGPRSGGAHRRRGTGGRTARARRHEAAGRRRALRLLPHRRHPPARRLRQARYPQPRGARPRLGHPPAVPLSTGGTGAADSAGPAPP